MSAIESEVPSVFIKDVTTKSVKNGTMTIWQVQTEDNTVWTTTRSEIGNAAIQLIGKKAALGVSIQQNGQYTNFYLNKIRPAEGQTEVGELAVRAAEAQQESARGDITFAEFSAEQRRNENAQREAEDRRNSSIHRQTASKVAAALQPTDANEFWDMVRILTHYYATGEQPFSPPKTTVTSHTPLSESSEPLSMSGTTYPQPNTDDDIPF